MYKIIVVFVFFLFSSCSLDKLEECIGDTGVITVQTIKTNTFTKLNIAEGVEVEIIQNPNYKIEIHAGKKNQKFVSFQVIDDELFLKNELTCSLGYTKPALIKVYVPNLTHVHSVSQYNLYTKQTVKFANLHLTHGLTMKNASSEIVLNIMSDNLIIESNNISSFKLTGQTNKLSVSFWSGGAKIDAYNMIANHATITQRSTNHMYLNVSESINGIIYGYGNVYLKQRPKDTSVQELFKGKLIVN